MPQEPTQPTAPAKPFVPGVTLLSVTTILCGLLLIGFMIQIGNVHAGASFMIGGLFGLPLRPVMVMIPLILLCGGICYLTKRQLYTRAELVCVLCALLVAPPIMTEGFWRYAIGAMVTIPQSSNMERLDGLSDKMWPHGENILADALTPAAMTGHASWEEYEVNADERASVPVLHNEQTEGTAIVRISVPVFKAEAVNLLLEEPYLLTVLARAENLAPESYYYCRIFYDDEGDFADEVFTSREVAAPGFLHPDGFLRKGRYGMKFAARVKQTAYIELGLVGAGRVAFADLSLVNVSAITELYDGRTLVSSETFEAMPPKLRGRVLVKPDSMLSLAGLKLVMTGSIPIREWVNPVIFWFSFIALLLAGTFAIAVIMRKQWLENERYPLPTAQIPIRLLGLDEPSDVAGQPAKPFSSIWTNQLMWTGFGVTLFWCLMKIWAAYNSSVPNLSINVPISPYFSDPSWGEMWGSVNFKVCSIFLALALFMELNVLMTLVLGFFLFRAQYWFGHAYGLSSTAGYPFQSDQMNGSYLVYALVVLFFTRKYLWTVLKRAWQGGRKEGEEQEVMSYRTCIVSLIACYFGVAAWASWAGIGVTGMLVFYTVMLLIAFVAAKLRAECGVPFSTYFPWGVMALVPMFGGAPLIIPGGFIFIAIVTELFVIRSFLLLPGLQLEIIELGRRAKVVPRQMLYVFVLGLCGAWLIGGWFVLSNSYTTGMSSASKENKAHWFRSYGTYIKDTDKLAAPVAVTEAPKSDNKGSSIEPPVWGVMYGAGTVTLVTVLRQLFAGFWFHPIGFLVGPSWMLQEAWGSILLAWVLRFSVLKLGGAATVREKLLPFATGIFLGGTAAYFCYAVTVSYLKFFVPGTPSVWWSIWAL